MIIEMLLNVIYGIISKVMILDIPDLPAEVSNYVDTAFDYIVAGAGVVANYVPLDYLMVLFTVLLAVDAGIMVYHFVMWVIKKIPFLGME